MKLISWNDNASRGGRDAKDIFIITKNYLDAGNQDRLYDDEIDLTDVEDFDYEMTGARLLGRDIARSFRPEILKEVLTIFDQQSESQKIYKLANDMRERYSNDRIEEKLQLLEIGVKSTLDSYAASC
ncbi:MAG: hypothetical protein KJO34_04925 [Deltaproteobacteria bacterium]|nr:hypothetical protein [Deltaproteobacteria bacterium]